MNGTAPRAKRKVRRNPQENTRTDLTRLRETQLGIEGREANSRYGGPAWSEKGEEAASLEGRGRKQAGWGARSELQQGAKIGGKKVWKRGKGMNGKQEQELKR